MAQTRVSRAIAALAEAMQEGLDSGRPLPAPAADAIRRFRGLGSAYIGFALSNPGLFHTAFCRPDGVPGDVRSRIEASRPYQLLSESLDGLVDVGLLDPARRPLAPIAFWSAVHGLSTLLIDGPLAALTQPERAGAIERTLDILIDGIGAPRAAAG
jgi:AcrR family transcriptional regulator